jgi:hypothetical protein
MKFLNLFFHAYTFAVRCAIYATLFLLVLKLCGYPIAWQDVSRPMYLPMAIWGLGLFVIDPWKGYEFKEIKEMDFATCD